MKTLSSIVTPSQMKVWLEILQRLPTLAFFWISSHTFICEGVTIEDNVFIGHGVTFINDSYPRSTTAGGGLQTEADWKVEKTVVKKGASIGSGATILSNISIGENAIVGAGSVVTKNVPPNTIVIGNPARLLRSIESTLEVTQQ